MVIRAVSNILVVCALLGWIAAISSAQGTQERKAAATTSSPPSGEELYKQHCAVCHGNNLKGNGPFPSPYRVPPDLTTLARRHQRGNFSCGSCIPQCVAVVSFYRRSTKCFSALPCRTTTLPRFGNMLFHFSAREDVR